MEESYPILLLYEFSLFRKLVLCGDLITDSALSFSGMEDLLEVSTYLHGLDKSVIYNLGMELGLDRTRLKDMKATSETFQDDVIAAWLRKEHNVSKKGDPTWRTLANALSTPRVGQNGIANKIENNKRLN